MSDAPEVLDNLMGLPLRPDPRHDAQDAFVRKWRASRSEEVWGARWDCPLCGKVLQQRLPVTSGSLDRPIAELMAIHKSYHGADWQRYLALGRGEDA